MKVLYHLAIIPDGNRRFAKERGLPPFEGHRQGFKRLIEIAKELRNKELRKLGIKVLTFWGFSTENWQREKKEVEWLMDIFKKMIDEYFKEAITNKIRVIHLGRKDRFDEQLRNKIIKIEEETKKFSDYYLAIALDYGGRDEIVRALNKAKKSKTKIDSFNFFKFLDTKDLPYPNPDLVIRTGKEKRTSGFMIWQTAYSEWIFYDKFFPEFTKEDLILCLKEYEKRQRRFGK